MTQSCHRVVRLGMVLITVVFVSAALATELQLGDIPMNLQSNAHGVPAVVFPHWKHRSLFRCYACHPRTFKMQANSTQISMDQLRQGQFCGECHNGSVAFAIGFNTCRNCHSHPEP